MTDPSRGDSLSRLAVEIVRCRRCPRLREYCRKIAVEKRRAFADWDYWAKPVAGFGEADAGIWIVGLAPGRMERIARDGFSPATAAGIFFSRRLIAQGLANQAQSIHREDGLAIRGVYISAAVRCAPPGNKPLPDEIANCRKYLDREWMMLNRVRVMLGLGKIGWEAIVALAKRHGCDFPAGKQSFAHGAELRLSQDRWLIGSYHVSQQNTFTGKLTPEMFDSVLERSRKASQKLNWRQRGGRIVRGDSMKLRWIVLSAALVAGAAIAQPQTTQPGPPSLRIRSAC